MDMNCWRRSVRAAAAAGVGLRLMTRVCLFVPLPAAVQAAADSGGVPVADSDCAGGEGRGDTGRELAQAGALP